MPLKPLKPEEKVSTEALIAAIERKDRRFRLFQTLFMVGTFVALMFIIGAQQRTLDGVKEQLTQAKSIAAETAKRSTDQQDTILRRLDCMSVFFSQKDRTRLSIENIDRCTLSRDGNLQEFFTQNPGEAPETTREPQNLTDSAPSATSENDVAPVPQDEGTTPPIDNPEVVEPRPPAVLETPIVDIPLCIPLLNVCVRQ